MRVFSQLRLLGLLSLSALFSGGAILIFIGVNAISAPELKDRARFSTQRRFRYGSQLSIQTWLAVVGVAFGLLAYGFQEAYSHLFDWWSSRQSRREDGLCYSRYLNSQPRAPLVYGLRGFSGFITLRYLLSLLSITATIGYKFSISQVEIITVENLNQEQFRISLPPVQALNAGTPSPWLGDAPQSNNSRGFFHDHLKNIDFNHPPHNITMTSLANCTDTFHLLDAGRVVSREIVLVANLTEDEGSYTMTSNHTGWSRIQTSNRNWFNNSAKSDRAVVDYRVNGQGEIQIQWARLGPWDNSASEDSRSSESEPVARRLTYNMHYAVAEIQRFVSGGDCSRLAERYSDDINSGSLTIFSNNYTAPEIKSTAIVHFRSWVDAAINSEETSVFEGVSVFVRAMMTAAVYSVMDDYKYPVIGVVPSGMQPFGPEDTFWADWNYYGDIEYPYYAGFRISEATGCYLAAAYIFLVIGIFGITAGLLRVWAGPPALTSWMGQHVYLALSGSVSIGRKADYLATGYEAAKDGLGNLRLPSDFESPLKYQALRTE
ncbi:hypothetical protein FOQG_15472 [Fusarium oxysporum f. sp. raphani 54005]|uniref:Uncharacterized protein n=2 Tax=Fusarium oxysporum TaxID=5507 RepID=X0BCU4_FUSOX|nr:hypothetical protein FOVG_15368 [Fusarium oxysporum f. sp. pisi HDV247]EXK79985.1 hypothetical protein FOQG_15472 [Fusarium oxysporum f. sp. raphani 54005]